MNKKPSVKGLYECEECHKLIPESVAATFEGEDYVWYFCGSECFEKWSAKHNDKK